MKLYTRIVTRPNTSTPWYFEPESQLLTFHTYLSHFNNTYVATNKCVNEVFDFSPDYLSFTGSAIWPNDADFAACEADPIMIAFWEERNVYCANNGIILGPVVITEI